MIEQIIVGLLLAAALVYVLIAVVRSIRSGIGSCGLSGGCNRSRSPKPNRRTPPRQRP